MPYGKEAIDHEWLDVGQLIQELPVGYRVGAGVHESARQVVRAAPDYGVLEPVKISV